MDLREKSSAGFCAKAVAGASFDPVQDKVIVVARALAHNAAA
jgi:hypothetical protein